MIHYAKKRALSLTVYFPKQGRFPLVRCIIAGIFSLYQKEKTYSEEERGDFV